MKIIAGIVTYNPNISDLKQSIAIILKQVPSLIIVDNGSDNISSIVGLMKLYEDVYFISNRHNLGIAFALNQIFRFAVSKKIEWVLTLDDDSIIPKTMIQNYFQTLKKYSNISVGIVGPHIVDRGSGRQLENFQQRFGRPTCITSGSLTNVAAWKAVNGFDNSLFIDGVDYDFVLRIEQAGYNIVEAGQVKMLHSLGETVRKRIFWISFDRITYSAFRVYYQERNTIYLRYRFVKTNIIIELIRHFKRVCITLLFEESKRTKIVAMHKGFLDGLRMVQSINHTKITPSQTYEMLSKETTNINHLDKSV